MAFPMELLKKGMNKFEKKGKDEPEMVDNKKEEAKEGKEDKGKKGKKGGFPFEAFKKGKK